MMRNMSFSLTERQFLAGTKDVTRRLGWASLKPGEHFMAVRKAMGLKRGEKLVKLGECECVSNRRVVLYRISKRDCRREGFPEHSPAEFTRMFCREMKCEPHAVVNRIEFRRVAECGPV